jgi:adenosyl cobinamide kinase/adenosyl cobinamide phosphate guanylyltransferase
MQVEVAVGGVVVDGGLRLVSRGDAAPGVDAFGWRAHRLRHAVAAGRAEVVDDQGRRLLWISHPDGLAALGRDGSAPPADAVLLSWPGPVRVELGYGIARLRAGGVLTERTELVVLLEEDRPVPARRLAAWGLRAVRPGEVLRVERAAPPPVLHPGLDPGDQGRGPGRRAGPAAAVGYDPSDPGRADADRRITRTLVLGPSSSGKSQVAEDLLAAEPVVRYLATGPVPDPAADPEWAARVAAHQDRRPGWWQTEQSSELAAALLHAGAPMLVDAIGTWVAGVMDRAGCWQDSQSRPGTARDQVQREVDAVVRAWRAAAAPVVAVSEEVGWSVVPATASGRYFRDVLGGLNQALAQASDRVLLVVAGRVVDLTGETW